MGKSKTDGMVIIQDSREKKPWDFSLYPQIKEVKCEKIDCGDYTTAKLLNKVVIERKATITEIANNLGKSTARERFYREFDRMKDLDKAYIVCEFPESDVYDYPKSSEVFASLKSIEKIISEQKQILKYKPSYVKNGKTLRRQTLINNLQKKADRMEKTVKSIRMNGKRLRSLIHQIEDDYPNIEVVFCKDREEAEKFTCDILHYWENQ